MNQPNIRLLIFILVLGFVSAEPVGCLAAIPQEIPLQSFPRRRSVLASAETENVEALPTGESARTYRPGARVPGRRATLAEGPSSAGDGPAFPSTWTIRICSIGPPTSKLIELAWNTRSTRPPPMAHPVNGAVYVQGETIVAADAFEPDLSNGRERCLGWEHFIRLY